MNHPHSASLYLIVFALIFNFVWTPKTYARESDKPSNTPCNVALIKKTVKTYIKTKPFWDRVKLFPFHGKLVSRIRSVCPNIDKCSIDEANEIVEEQIQKIYNNTKSNMQRLSKMFGPVVMVAAIISGINWGVEKLLPEVVAETIKVLSILTGNTWLISRTAAVMENWEADMKRQGYQDEHDNGLGGLPDPILDGFRKVFIKSRSRLTQVEEAARLSITEVDIITRQCIKTVYESSVKYQELLNQGTPEGLHLAGLVKKQAINEMVSILITIRERFPEVALNFPDLLEDMASRLEVSLQIFGGNFFLEVLKELIEEEEKDMQLKTVEHKFFVWLLEKLSQGTFKMEETQVAIVAP